MKEDMKDVMIADVEKIQAVEDFLSEWYSVSDLFETAANAGSVLLELVNIWQLAQDDVKHITSLINQHVMLANLLKKFEKGGEQ